MQRKATAEMLETTVAPMFRYIRFSREHAKIQVMGNFETLREENAKKAAELRLSDAELRQREELAIIIKTAPSRCGIQKQKSPLL